MQGSWLLENVTGLLMWHMVDDPPQPPAVAYVVAELEALVWLGWTCVCVPAHVCVRVSVFVTAKVVI
jgi:hypothetical protein